MDPDDFLPLIVVGTVMIVFPILAVWCIWIVVQVKARREAHRLEFQSRLLDKVGSTKEFGEFLTTEQGQRFLDALTPTSVRPGLRAFDMLRFGLVILVAGLVVLFGVQANVGGVDWRMAFPATLLTALGLGMVVAAAVSYRLAEKFGAAGDGESDRAKTRSNPTA